MAYNTPIHTENQTLEEIFANSKQYQVPKFQRDYSWEQEQWQVLWDDIQTIAEASEDYHYMGYLVLQQGQQNKQFIVVDGQQRLTTFSLLALSAIGRFKQLGHADTAKEFFRRFIGSEQYSFIKITEKKLILNKNNEYYYNQLVSFYKQDAAAQQAPIHKRGQKQTVILMGKAIEYFSQQLAGLSAQKISELLQTMAERVLFTTIFIADQVNAYKIFETLNARGVQLSTGDLLKNYIFSAIDTNGQIPDEELNRLEEIWENIGHNVGKHKYSDYILVQWKSSHRPLRPKQHLFTTIKKQVCGEQQASTYLQILEQDSELYSALLDYEHHLWKDFDQYQQVTQDIRVLNLFNLKQPISVLLAAYKKYKPKQFATILHWLMVFSIRYNVICRLYASEQEHFYSKLCQQIQQQTPLAEVKTTMLQGLYPNDELFKRAFSEKSLPTEQSNKKARYILVALCQCMGDKALDEQQLTVEHLLPLKPNQFWQDSFEQSTKAFATRLGNMALVDSKINQELGQKPFAQKRQMILQQNICPINQSLADYMEWTTDTIHSRQREMAQTACRTWQIN